MKNLFEYFYKCSGVFTDTRNILKDGLFIALKGDNFNGNKYANSAINKGALYAIVDESKYANHTNIFLVEDCLVFLQALANNHRRKLNTPIIGITGTNGKTTSKELINAVLDTQLNVLATKGNLNNHIGVPLTLLDINSSHDIAIIEMGASKPADIKELCEIAEPTHGTITNIGNAHMEGFKTFEGVYKTKMELFDFINETSGVFTFNENDSVFDKLESKKHKAILMPFGKNNQPIGTITKCNPLLEFKWKGNAVKSKLVGEYNLYNFLTAISLGVLFGIKESNIIKALTSYTPSNNRSQFSKTKYNKLIIDCYNANPSSVSAAIENIKTSEAENKVLILGDMLELGSQEKSEHEKIIRIAKEAKIKTYTVGKAFKSTLSDFAIKKFDTVEDSIAYFDKTTLKNSLILIKGSRGIALEKLINKL